MHDAALPAQQGVVRQFQTAAGRVFRTEHLAQRTAGQRSERLLAVVALLDNQSALILVADVEHRQFAQLVILDVIENIAGADVEVARTLFETFLQVSIVAGRVECRADACESAADGRQIADDQAVAFADERVAHDGVLLRIEFLHDGLSVHRVLLRLQHGYAGQEVEAHLVVGQAAGQQFTLCAEDIAAVRLQFHAVLLEILLA